MKFMTGEVRTRSNYQAGVSIVFPAKTGTRSIVEWSDENGFKGDPNPDFDNQVVYCLYRDFRDRISSAIIQWLATKGRKDLDTLKSNWHLVLEHWPKIYNQNTHLIPIQGWVDPKKVNVAIHTDNLNVEMNKLAKLYDFTPFAVWQNKTDQELLDFVKQSITESMWQEIEKDPVYQIEVDACTHWLTLTH